MLENNERVVLNEEQVDQVAGGRLLKNCQYNAGIICSDKNPTKKYYYDYSATFDGKKCIVAIDWLAKREMAGEPDEKVLDECVRRGYISETPFLPGHERNTLF